VIQASPQSAIGLPDSNPVMKLIGQKMGIQVRIGGVEGATGEKPKTHDRQLPSFGAGKRFV